MAEQVRSNWYSVVREQGVSDKDAETIQGAFVYDGFERKIEVTHFT
jgi:serine/threonine-protein kinase HipA